MNIKKILIICLISLLFAGCSKMTGSGTQADPYVIYDINDLEAVNNDLNAYYVLGNDIDASNFNFTPIGDSTHAFEGTFDGKNHKIDSLAIDLQARGNQSGLFARINQATIKNIILTNINYSGNGDNNFEHIGGIVGESLGSNITCCKIQGKISITSTHYEIEYIGGIAGDINLSSSCNYCDADINMILTNTGTNLGIGVSEVGGIIGYNDNDSEIQYCSSKGSITTKAEASEGDGEMIGGIVGWGSADNSYSQVDLDITAEDLEKIGGAIGDLSHSSSNLYSSGQIKLSDGSYVKRYIGGLLGKTEDNDITDGFWDIETSGLSESASGIGKTTAEMYQQATYTNWDFANVWSINEGNDYPVLIDKCICIYRPFISYIIWY